MDRRALSACVALALAGCGMQHPLSTVSANTRQSACSGMSLAFLGSGSIGPETMFDGARVGGLSGIDYDTSAHRFVLITDDRGANGGARLFTAEIGSQPDQLLSIALKSALPLRTEFDGPSGARETKPGVDGEAVRILPRGALIWASEGDDATKQPPGVYLTPHRGTTARPLSFPSELQTDTANSKGPRPNRSFEGLALAPDAKSVFIALEAPLRGMSDLPTLTQGADAPIYLLDFNGRIKARFDYPLEPIARQEDGLLADNGISEILALGTGRFLVLERSGSQQRDGSFRFVTRLFCAWSAKDAKPKTLQKRLVADFNQLGPFDTANFEGMTFGDPLHDGRQSLFLVADNDFRPDRPTLLVKFAMHNQPMRD